MKKLVLFAVAALSIISCGQRSSAVVDNSTPLEKFLEGYHETHPDWLINDIVAQKTNDSLMTAFESAADTIFDRYPMKAVSVRQYTDSTFCVNLRAWQRPYGFSLKKGINEIGGDIIALVSEEQALKVKEDDFYTFKGKFVKRTNHEFYQETTGMRMHYTDRYGVTRDDTFKDEYEFNFGILVYVVDSLMAYK